MGGCIFIEAILFRKDRPSLQIETECEEELTKSDRVHPVLKTAIPGIVRVIPFLKNPNRKKTMQMSHDGRLREIEHCLFRKLLCRFVNPAIRQDRSLSLLHSRPLGGKPVQALNAFLLFHAEGVVIPTFRLPVQKLCEKKSGEGCLRDFLL